MILRLPVTLLLAAGALACVTTAAAEDAPTTICVVTPKAQLGQGTSGVDAAEPVLGSIMTYLSGPATSIIPLQSRIDVQIKAEAEDLACAYVLKTSVVHKKGGKGFGGLLAAAPALMGAMPYVGGGGMGAYQAQAVAQAAVQGAAAAEQQEAQQSAMDAMAGVTQSNIKKGDQVTLEYSMSSIAAGQAPIKGKLNRKAADNGEDVLSPLIEEMANAVLNAALAPAS